ncbi:hypothetical protein ABE571_00865 [Stenotrophomonas sp. TWI273]
MLETWWPSIGSRLPPESPGGKDIPAVWRKLSGQWWALQSTAGSRRLRNR